MAEQRQGAEAERQRQAEAAETERQAAEEQRSAMEAQLGVGERTRALWEQVKSVLNERQEFSLAFHSAFLLPLNGRRVTIATPIQFYCQAIEKRTGVLKQAIEEVSGKQLEAIEVRFIEPAITGN